MKFIKSSLLTVVGGLLLAGVAQAAPIDHFQRDDTRQIVSQQVHVGQFEPQRYEDQDNGSGRARQWSQAKVHARQGQYLRQSPTWGQYEPVREVQLQRQHQVQRHHSKGWRESDR